MNNIEFVKGDMIELTKQGKFDAVGHGANCFHTMGAGIAPKLNKMSDGKLLKVDKTTPYGDINKLGTITCCSNEVNGRVVRFFNLYTQYTYGDTRQGQVYVHWGSVFYSLMAMITLCPYGDGTDIGIPLIGCGLAGGSRRNFLIPLARLESTNVLVERNVNLTVVELP